MAQDNPTGPAGTGPRKYEKRARAKREEMTRGRIVAAALALFESGGAPAVTVSAVARQAGVQRLTVYRHFPGGDGLVNACTGRQAERHPAPDPADWAAITDPPKRLRRALRRLYAWYRDGGRFFDMAGLGSAQPEPGQSGDAVQRYLEGVLATLEPGWSPRGKRARQFEAALDHAVRFSTWRSLCMESGLEDKAAARLMERLVRSVARRGR